MDQQKREFEGGQPSSRRQASLPKTPHLRKVSE